LTRIKTGERERALKRGGKDLRAKSAHKISSLPFAGLVCCFFIPAILAISGRAQSQPAATSTATTETQSGPENQPLSRAPASKSSASIHGTVVDKDGALIANAKVILVQQDLKIPLEAISGGDGTFTFPDAVPGAFHLTCTASGFASREISGSLQPGQDYIIPQVELEVGLATVDIEVTVKQQVEIAEQQIHLQEQQRIFGAIPNFFVSYIPNAVPLNSRQKFELAWKSSIDPVSFGIAAGFAGIQQASNSFSGYGQGAQGYAKRFGASFADLTIGTFIGSAILPSLLKQDPRYFYKGTGSRKSRLGYALASAFICKGDNGRWQANYSNMLGSLAAGGISNLYYPASNRNGAGLTLENGLLGIGGSAIGAVIQEFFLRRLTPHVPEPQPAGL
jgi:Carboxypeptidase regulatory-like domain